MKYTHLIAALISGLIVSGCATQATNTDNSFRPEAISGSHNQKTDHFLVIVDTSSSMGDAYDGNDFAGANKLAVEKTLLSNMNQTIPSSLNLTSGIRTYGFGPCQGWQYTQMKSGMEAYSSAAFDDGINSIACASGGTPMYRALTAAGSDLADTTGQIAVIILSDGQADTSPIPEAQALKAQYGDRLCIYSVWVGNNDEHAGHAVMGSLADAGGCGFVTQASSIASPAGMTDFVTRVFLDDGPKDTDGDGVYDHEDQCPNTPKGATVNKLGCWIIKGINFDTDKSNIKSRYHSLLNNVVTVIERNPGLNVEIQGHTDSQGSSNYNMGLSDRRANSVMKYFISRGIDGSRLSANGYGESRPIDSNSTSSGRANNRRVELRPH